MISDSNTDRQLAGLCRRGEMDETKRELPLPVQDMVRHMTRSLGSTTTSGHNLPDLLPLNFRHDQCDSQKVKVSLTSNVHTLAKTFSSSPSCASVSSSTLNKLTRPANMDAIVPSGSSRVLNVARPPISFHDQRRSAVVRFPTNFQFSSTSLNSSSEACDLDRIERVSMKFRRDNTAHQTTAGCIPAEFSVAAKLQHDDFVAKHLSSNAIVSELDMEQTISLDDVMMSSDNDSQCPYSKADIIHHSDVSECSAAISSRLSGAAHSAPSSVHTSKHVQPVPASTNGCHQLKAVSANILENINSFTIHFPQRACRPQIGIAAVIKSNICPRQGNDRDKGQKKKKDNDTQETIKFQSAEMHKLVNVTSPQSDHFTCSKVDHKRRNVSVQIRASANQIVPSSSSISKWESLSTLQTATVSSDMLPSQESTDEKWKEVKNFLRSPDYEPSVKKRKRADSGSSGQISDDDDNADDEYDYDDISSSVGDKYDDSDDDYSDIDADLADIKPSECESLVALGKKQKQYFWQYNVQSKGPKGTRLRLSVESPSDPHVLNHFEDPVFDQCNTAIAGIRHGGKARKGDGNEITPNPKKLFMIGHQLMRLSHQINSCQLGTDVPLAKRNQARKEKNKLASRACRLKKKAQHEANKIKLYGLEQEHSQLNSVLQLIWPQIHEAAKSFIANTGKLSCTSDPLTRFLEAQISHNLKSMIAGHTVEYVNSVILKVESGDYSGGLNTKRSHRA